jgi:hypothetical protein
MSAFLSGLVVGGFAGGSVGVIIMAIIAASRDTDARDDEAQRAAIRGRMTRRDGWPS